MNLFQTIILDIILIVSPLLIYLLYEGYNKIYDKEKNDLCLDFCLVTSFYLILTFNEGNVDYPYLMITIPLIIAYLRKRNISIVVLSFLSCHIFSRTYNIFFPIVIIEYITYYLINKIFEKRRNLFITSIILLKTIFCLIYGFINNKVILNINSIFNILIIILPFIISTYIIVILLKKIDDMHLFEQNSKQLEEEKQLRMSLFKITHEIKNPITVCKGYLDMFDINDNKKSKKYINIIKEEINRVLVLLEDFLSINKIKIEKEIVDLNLLLEDMTNSFIPILKEKNIDWNFNITKDELFVEIDYNRIIQVLINLMKNSVESIDKDGLISVYTKINKTNIKIYIEDNGIGMDTEELNKISEPFYSTKQKGTGLGVYLSKQIIESHGGSIKYISKKYLGTKAIITLPYKELLN